MTSTRRHFKKQHSIKKQSTAVLQVAAVATFGMMSNNNQYYVQANSLNNMQRMHDDDEKPDSIAKSNVDDMFAFSQIIAGGQNPLQVANQIEKEAREAPEKSNNGLSDDQAVAAYAEFMSGEGEPLYDPNKDKARLARAAAEQKAQAELKQFQENDSTSAFAALAESQGIETKAENYKGSSPENPEADNLEIIQPKKINPNKLLAQILKKKKQTTPKVKKQDVSLLDQNQDIVLPEQQNSAILAAQEGTIKKKSKIQWVVDKLKAGNTVEQVRDLQKEEKGDIQTNSNNIQNNIRDRKVKVAPPAPVAKPPKEEEVNVDAQADAQAEEIISQIKAAAMNLKTANSAEDVNQQTAALQAILGDAKSVAAANLVQLNAEINIQNDPDADEAISYLAHQFPDEYPTEKQVKKEKPPTAQELIQAERKQINDYSKEVLAEATDYQDELKEQKKQKDEAKMTTLEIAGMQPDDQKLIQLAPTSEQTPGQIIMAQTSNGQQIKAQSSQKLKAKAQITSTNKNKSFSLNQLGLTADQLAFIDEYTHINDKNENDQENSQTDQLKTQMNNMALTQLDPSQLSSDDMKSYSESIAKAAEVVNNESDKTDQTGQLSVSDLKLQALAVKAQQQPSGSSTASLAQQVENQQQQELEAKAAIVAQAEAANSAAMGQTVSQAPNKEETNKPQIDKQATPTDKTFDPKLNLGNLSEQQKIQFEADKQSALQQGYSPDQADQYAKQEALVWQNKKQAEAAQEAQAPKGSQNDAAGPGAKQQGSIPTPASGVTTTPPTLINEAAVGATKTEQDSGLNLSLQEQIQKAQEKQDTIKAALQQKQQETQLQTEIVAQSSQQPVQQGVRQGDGIMTSSNLEIAQAQAQAEALASQANAEAKEEPKSQNQAKQEALEKQAQEEAANQAEQIQQQLAAQGLEATEENIQQIAQQLSQNQAKGGAQAESAPAAATVPTPAPAATIPAEVQQPPVEAIAVPQVNADKQVSKISSVQTQNTDLSALTPVPQQNTNSLIGSKAETDVESHPMIKAVSQAKQETQQLETNQIIPMNAIQKNQKVKTPFAKSAIKQAIIKPKTVKKVEALSKPKIVPKTDQVQSQLLGSASPNQKLRSIVGSKIGKEIKNNPKFEKLPKNKEKQTLQQEADLHIKQTEQQETPQDNPNKDIHQSKDIKQPTHRIFLDQQRAIQYESDLNKARDEIKRAQNEMANIDSQVTNFHQKMAKSMHSLLQAFSEGFEAMDKAKKDEVQEIAAQKEQRANDRVKKLGKLHSSISNLEELTSKLKMSFNEDKQPEEQIQTSEDLQTEVPKALQDLPEKQPKNTVTPKNAVKSFPIAKQKQVAQIQTHLIKQPIKQIAVPQIQTANKMVSPVKKVDKSLTAKMVNPQLKEKLLASKLASKPTSKTNLKQKMQALLTAKAKNKALAKQAAFEKAKQAIVMKKSKMKLAKMRPKVSQKPLQLAQTMSTSQEDVQNFAKTLASMDTMKKLQELKDTQSKLHHISAAIGKSSASTQEIGSLAQSLGIHMDDKMKNEAARLGSNKLIAHAMANRVMTQLNHGKQKADIAKDLKKTNESLLLAKKAFYDKNPEALEFIQIDEQVNLDTDDRIYLSAKDQRNEQQLNNIKDDIHLQDNELSLIGTGPSDSEDEMQALIDAEDKYDSTLTTKH